MPFLKYVHSIVSSSDDAAWPVEAQGLNQCGCVSASNALNLLVHTLRFHKDDFVREAGLMYQPKLGGTLSPVTTWLIQRHGFGTHFGNLQKTDYEVVLRALIDHGIPVIIELYSVKVGGFAVSGQHAIVLVGYSDPFQDTSGQTREEYYLVDAQWPALGSISLRSNDRDVDGDGVAENFPGNRTLTRQELRDNYPMRTYFPVFPTQSDHDAWYGENLRTTGGIPLLRSVTGKLLDWVIRHLGWPAAAAGAAAILIFAYSSAVLYTIVDLSLGRAKRIDDRQVKIARLHGLRRASRGLQPGGQHMFRQSKAPPR